MKKLRHYFKLASIDGLGVTTNANGDYSSGSASFRAVADSDDDVVINRMILSIDDSGINNSNSYGNIPALTNGIMIYVKDDQGNIIDTPTPFAIKDNGDWAATCHDVNIFSIGGGDDTLSVRWTFSRSGHPLVLRSGYYLEIVLNDDFTGLTNHNFFLQGYYETENY